MATSTLLLIVLIILLVGAVPAWPHSRGWGYGPSGVLGVVLVVLLVLALMNRVLCGIGSRARSGKVEAGFPRDRATNNSI
jgi:peptidoglycan/LPS O-acetylase OafA/YrhL